MQLGGYIPKSIGSSCNLLVESHTIGYIQLVIDSRINGMAAEHWTKY